MLPFPREMEVMQTISAEALPQVLDHIAAYNDHGPDALTCDVAVPGNLITLLIVLLSSKIAL